VKQDFEVSMTEILKVVVKTFEVIETLNKHQSLSLKDITKIVKLPKPTIFRILHTLQSLGYVEYNSKIQEHSLSHKFITYAQKSIDNMDIIEVAKPFMVKLRDKYKETVNLAKLVDNEMTFIHIIESTHQFRYVDHIGDKAALHTTAVAKSVLAYMSIKELELLMKDYQFTAFTKKTIKDYETFKKHLSVIRNNGYAIDDEEGTEGVLCIGCPIFNKDHKPFAAISISIPKVRTNREMLKKINEELPRITMQISMELGVSNISKCFLSQ